MKLKGNTLLLFLGLLSVSFTAWAEDSLSIVQAINASGSIVIEQPEELNKILNEATLKSAASATTEKDDTANKDTQATTRAGYRVQVFDDNNPSSARRNAESTYQRISSEFPHLKSYISFNSPYWRVKTGDFKTRAEAEAVMAQIQAAFPSLRAYLRVVRDRVNIPD